MTSRALSLINGIGRMITISSLDSFYDSTITYGSFLASGSSITLPSSGTYTNLELMVFLGGQFLEASIDYAYVGTAPRTQIQILRDIYTDDKLRFRINFGANIPYIYDQVITSNITSGVAITLPLSKQYSDAELNVYLSGQLLEPVIDYNYLGLAPTRTQIAMTFDIFSTERLRFRIE